MGGLQFDSQRKIFEGINAAAKEDGNRLYFFACDLSSAEKFNKGELNIFSLAELEKFDGAVFYSETIYDDETREKIVARIKKSGIPCVSINDPDPGILNISDDNWDVMQHIVDRLVIEKGVEVVNYVAGPQSSKDDTARRTSCREALEKYGLGIPNERMYFGDFQSISGRKAVEYFRERHLLKADAYICSNDLMALGVYYALLEEGINAPEDVYITGFDNIFIARSHTPRITTVERNERFQGRRAYEMLMAAFNGESQDNNVFLPCHVKWGSSCGIENAGREEASDMALNHFVRMKLRSDRYTAMLGDLTAEMTSVGSLGEYIDVVKNYIALLAPDECYLCLNEEFIENDLAIRESTRGDAESFDLSAEDAVVKDYSERISIVIAYRDGAFRRGTEVAKGELIPGGIDSGMEGAYYVISPLHYLDRCFGYVAICNSKIPLESNFYHMFLMALSSGLENVRDTIQKQNMIKRLNEMWVYDALTHVYNRAGFLKYADRYVDIARLAHQKLFFMFLDMDHLKKVNDEQGHDMGDRMIKAMADILDKNKRPDELLMRYGGDEFVILARGYSEETGKEYVERIHEAMRAYSEENKLVIPLEASIGYYIVDSTISEPVSTIIKLADKEMYEAKKGKRRS